MIIDRGQAKFHLPDEKEVVRIINSLCEKCGYNSERVTLKYVGSERRQQFKGFGVKLVNPESFSVIMYIGGRHYTIETHFYLREIGSKNSIRGELLFRKMLEVFEGKILLVEEEKKKEVKVVVEEKGVNPIPESTPETETSSDPEETTLAREQDPESLTPPEEVPVNGSNHLNGEGHGEVTTFPKVYDTAEGFFKDPGNIHLAMVALATLCGGDSERPFNYNQFCRVLTDEIAMPPSKAPLSVYVRTFVNRDFLKKQAKGLYTVTEEGLKFASGPPPTAPVLTIFGRSLREPKPSRKVEKPSVDLDQAQQFFELLQSSHYAYEQLKVKLTEREADLGKLHEEKIAEEEAGAQSQIRALEERIEGFRRVLADLEGRRKGASSIKAEIAQIKQKLEDPKLLQAVKSFESFKSALVGKT